MRIRPRASLALPAVLVLGACAADATPSPSAASSAAVAPSVSLVGDDPVLQPDELGDYSWVLAAAGTIHDATTHAWVVAFGDARGEQELIHLTSSDGAAWEVADRDIEAQLGIEFSPPGPMPGTVLRTDEGEWVMYFSAVRAPASSGFEIWRATAPGPSGPWIADPEPVLPLGAAGDWDGMSLDFPGVVRADDGYLMLFGTAESPTSASIGAATSEDGIVWTRTAAPVIRPGLCGEWDGGSLAMPRLLADTDGGWTVVYGGLPEPDAGMALGLARSDDGLSWTCATPEPMLEYGDIPNSTRIHSVAAIGNPAGPRLLLESIVETSSELWLADLEG